MSHALRLAWLLLWIFCASLAAAQTPQYDLAAVVGSAIGTSRTEATKTVVDAAGNIYVVGQFLGMAQFGAFTRTSVSPPHDVFVAKLSPTGTCLWVAQGGSLADDMGTDIGLDGAGNVYVTGTVVTGNSNATFGTITLPGTGSGNDLDVFVAKLSPAGTWLWAVSGGGSRSDEPAALAVDAAGNTYVTGRFLSPGIAFGSTTLPNPYFQFRSFTAKLDAAGNWQWAVAGGGNSAGSTEANDIALDDLGNAYITGDFSGPSVSFGTLPLVSGSLYPTVFVAKLSPTGTYVWAVQGGGGVYDVGIGIAVDRQRNVYITGSFNSATARFGPYTLSNINTAPARTYTDIFVAKLDANGQYLWATGGGGLYEDQGRALAIDAQDNVLLTGYYNSPSINLGPLGLPNRNVGSPGSFGFYDVFVAKFNPAGQYLWAVRGGGNGTEFSFGIAVGGPQNAPHIVGYHTTDPAAFGPFTLPNNPSNFTGYVARLTNPATAIVQGDSLLCQGGQLVLTASGTAAVSAYRWSTGASTAAITVSQPGTYTVTVIFSNGQTATTQLRVVQLTPSLRIIGDSLLCPGRVGQLTASSSAPATFLWSTGAVTPNLSIAQPGTYTLAARYGTGCTVQTRVTVRSPVVQITGLPQLCPDQGSRTTLTAVATGATGYRWSNGATTPSLTIAQAGTYSVAATFANGCVVSAQQTVSAPQAIIQGDSVLCAGRGVVLSALQSTATGYLWSTGATTPAITVTQPGSYAVSVAFGSGCTATARYQVRAAIPNPSFSLGADTTICEGDQLLLRIPTPGGAGIRYQWSDGSAGPTLLVQQPGVYSLQRITRCETRTASRQITQQNCFFIPNIITPNADGINDLFVVKGLGAGPWKLELYNRWGRQVYRSDAYHNEWGSEAAPGIHYYLLRRPSDGQFYKGWIEVVR
jgi:hypothetical protein